MSFRMKAPMLWTTEDCVSWFESLNNVKPELKKALIDEFRTENIEGDGLVDVLCDAKELRDQLSDRLPKLKPSDANKVVNAFQAEQSSRRSGSNQNATVESAAAGAVNGYSFTVTTTTFTVFVSGIRKTGVVKIHDVRADHTVKDLKNFIRDKESVSVQNFGLHKNKELTDGDSMAKCGIGNETVVHYFSLTNGGCTMANKVGNRRHINWSAHPNIRKSRKGDCLFAYRMRDGYSVAEMPCGHSMESDSMYRYMNSIIKANVAEIRIFCPVPKCKRQWEFKLCCRVAGMDDNEYVEYARKKDLRSGDDIRTCPHCAALCKRKADVSILRMNCSSCSNQDWCWVCGKIWKSGNLMYCGNSGCKFIADINEQLASCDASVPLGWSNIDRPEAEKKLPAIRSCPSCLRFIKKPSGCKHMECKGCKKKFCFACLRSQNACNEDKGSSHMVFCFVAPRQKFS